ncbi:MAG: cell envelope integrity protein TolA [Myxococcaceae bacterium]
MSWRSTARRPKDGLRLFLGMGLGLVLHGLALLVWLLLPPSPRVERRPPPQTPAPAFAMRPLSDSQWQKNRGPARPAPPPKPIPLTPTPPPKGQVVAVQPGNREESPDAKYLAETSNTVKRETRARETTPHYRNAMPRETSPNPRTGEGQTGSPLAGLGGRGNATTPPAQRRGTFEVPDSPQRDRLAMRAPRTEGLGPSLPNRAESEAVRGNSKRLRIEPGNPEGADSEASEGRAGTRGPLQLMPSQAVLDQITGAAANDRLENIEEGEGTFLNTKEWRYASFFNRVKQSVGIHWNPGVPLRQRDPTGDIYSGKDRYTLLTVTLDDKGSLRDIAVEKSSGLEFLDAEAIAAFHRAQPFPNPPPGLLDGDARVRFSFGFFLELGAGPRLRLFRQPY